MNDGKQILEALGCDKAKAARSRGAAELREAFGVRGACSRFRAEKAVGGTNRTRCKSAGKPYVLQTLRVIAAIADE